MAKTKKHVFHLQRLFFFSFLFAAFFIVRADAGALPRPLASHNVLAYATDMSLGGLLAATNNARAANGQAALALNSQLNSSAQSKAQDMATKNYWAHVSPDGTEPWYFFTQAGYNYTKAGENLAYGFMTSQATVDGWMNSPSHRANMLDNYYDVGCGVVNTPNYQSSGQQTIVVAHYGVRAMVAQPAAPAPAPAAPTQPTPAPAPTPAPTPASQTPSSSPTDTTQPGSPEPVADKPAEPQSETTPQKTDTTAPAVAVATAQPGSSSVLNMLTRRTVPIAGLVSLMLVCVAITGYALTHRSAFQHAVTAGEHFAIRHPGLDAGIVAAVTMLILLTTYGRVG